MYTCQCEGFKWVEQRCPVKGGGCISEVSFNTGSLCVSSEYPLVWVVGAVGISPV